MNATAATLLIVESSSFQLERVKLGRENDNEGWLQQLTCDHPQLLPKSRLESQFRCLVPLARDTAQN